MPVGAWEKLGVLVDADLEADLSGLPRGTQDAIFLAIYRYADTGHGGQVAYRAPGGLYIDEVHVDGLAVRFHVDPIGKNGPTMIVSEVCALESDRSDD